jgi:hypothetical protein
MSGRSSEGLSREQSFDWDMLLNEWSVFRRVVNGAKFRQAHATELVVSLQKGCQGSKVPIWDMLLNEWSVFRRVVKEAKFRLRHATE